MGVIRFIGTLEMPINKVKKLAKIEMAKIKGEYPGQQKLVVCNTHSDETITVEVPDHAVMALVDTVRHLV